MQITIRGDSVELVGYVNAIERNSKPLYSRMGQFVERICKGAFKRALKRNNNVRILLNHNWDRDLGGQKDGNLDLEEDSIGLRVRATITDKDVVEKAKRGDLVGWSFGFQDVDVDNHLENGTPVRSVRDLDLYEVSILDRTKTPAYDGTLVTVRSEDNIFHGDPLLDEIEVREITEEVTETEDSIESPIFVEETREEPEEEPKQHENVETIDYSKYEELINQMKQEDF